jgi:signal transduction histidine kinase
MTFERLTKKQFNHLLGVVEEAAYQPATVSDSAFMRALSSIDRRLLAALLEEQQCPPRSTIFTEGDDGDTVYLIRSGRIAAITGDLDAPTFLGCRGPGEVIGEMALLENRPRSATVIALDEMRLLRIDGEGFHRLLRQSPAASMSIMALLSARLRQAEDVRNVEEQLREDEIVKELASQLSTLESEKQELLQLQRVRQETTDLIIHDLRNPLSLMFSASQMLEMMLPEDVIQANWELFDVIKTAHIRMRRLVDSLLDIARMETGKAPLDLTTAELDKLVEEAATPATFSMKKRGIELHQQIPDGLPKLKVDQDKIVRVLGNLMDNAVKYMSGGGDLTIDAGVADNGDEEIAKMVLVSVTDTGPGIPPADRERVFERFSQVSGSGRPRGFGLGLVFCRLTVEAHGGRIWVESGENDSGCRFVFTLPAAG